MWIICRFRKRKGEKYECKEAGSEPLSAEL